MKFDPTTLNGSTTWAALRETPLGRCATVSSAGQVLEAELPLDAGECMAVRARAVLRFYGDRLERVLLHAEEPPWPKNERWWRREDEAERERHHAEWLGMRGLATGWAPWGELVSGYESARRLASIRWRFAHEGAPWNPVGTVAPPPRPSACIDLARGALRVRGAWLGAGTSRAAFADLAGGSERLRLGPGELLEHVALVVPTFAGERLVGLDVVAVSERFGADWDDHGPEESAAQHGWHVAWITAAAGAARVDAAWGRLGAFADERSGHRAVRLELFG